MSDVFAKLRQQREPKPATIAGETVYVRALLREELNLAMQFPNDDASLGLALAFGLVSADGNTLYERLPDEELEAFGQRVLSAVNLPGDIEIELVQTILKLSKGFKPKQLEQLEKN